MAKITHYIGEISGKLGGQVYARNKAGSYVKNFVTPTNPNTVPQTVARAAFAAQVTSWHALSDAQKTAWNTFATNYFKPKFGQTGTAFSGFNAFVSLNNTLKNISVNNGYGNIQGMTATTDLFPLYNADAPNLALGGKIEIATLGPGGTALASSITVQDGSWGISDNYFELNFQVDGMMTPTAYPIFRDPSSGENVSLIVMASLPGTQKQEFTKGPNYRLISKLDLPTVTVGPTGPTNEIVVRFTPSNKMYKYSYSEGQAVTLSAFLVGSSGQTQPLGSKRVVIGS